MINRGWYLTPIGLSQRSVRTVARRKLTKAERDAIDQARARWHFETPIVGNLLGHPELQPDLDDRDRRCLVIRALGRLAETKVFAHNAPMPPLIRHCTFMSVDVYARWESPDPSTWARRRDELVRECGEWIRETKPGQRIDPKRDSLRIQRVRRLAQEIDKQIGVKRSFPKSLRNIGLAAKTLEVGEGELIAQSLFAPVLDAKGAAWACFVDEQGEVVVGHRQARDAIAKKLGVRRKRRRGDSDPMVGAKRIVDDADAGDQLAVDEDIDPLDAVDQVRAIRVLQARPQPRSVIRRLVRQHLDSLLTGELSLSEFARRVGRSKGAIHQELTKEKAELAQIRRDS